MDAINILAMEPQEILAKEAFTRIIPSPNMTSIGEAKSIGTDSDRKSVV